MAPLRREARDEAEDVGRLPRWFDRISRGGHVLAPGDPDAAMRGIGPEKEARILAG
ncbi:hypothetical protein [Streptosporangium sp. 'caverna']|uniref:hypothetical protein n=1 Tax=Streptosporangium sp. 'caverna' TaxID=2202249 RepID=UPI0013A69CCA|nr:hypothetical protein [Streptosporangium sp. 'caverna']